MEIGERMAEKLDPKETVSFEELLKSNTITQEALVRLLVEKGILTTEEILEKIVEVRKEGEKHVRPLFSNQNTE